MFSIKINRILKKTIFYIFIDKIEKIDRSIDRRIQDTRIHKSRKKILRSVDR